MMSFIPIWSTGVSKCCFDTPGIHLERSWNQALRDRSLIQNGGTSMFPAKQHYSTFSQFLSLSEFLINSIMN